MEIGYYDDLYSYLESTPKFYSWAQDLKKQVPVQFDTEKDGNLQRWLDAFTLLPQSKELPLTIDDGHATFGDEHSFSLSHDTMTDHLKKFMPWRKGPWQLGGVKINTEWHSDWKWERVAPHLSDLKGRKILDVGSGNGYYCFRMIEQGAESAIGIDPGMLAVVQYTLMKRYAPNLPVWVLPLGIEEMPETMSFDTVFSMGVLYHRKSPIDHIYQLKGLLRSGGELVLETMVVEESYGDLLLPEDRYQQMRNVWFIPSVTQLETWIRRCGFKNVRCVCVETTTIEEQRKTEWMQFDSLEQFLDPDDQSKTIEGYPAPRRAVIIAEKP